MIRPALTTLAAAACLTGCAHVAQKPAGSPGVGSASYRTDAHSGLAHYQLALGQVAMGATLEAHEPPAYPSAMLAACPPRAELPARVIVDARGRVSDVRMEPAAPPAFAGAIRQAVRGWRYTPLTLTRWAADANGTSHPVDSESKPFSLDYVFTFQCEHGRTSVSAGPERSVR